MAKYLISSPAFINGVHIGAGATAGNKLGIEVGDDVPPSVTWEPLDEAALKSLNKAVDALVAKRTAHLDPKRHEHQIKTISEEVRAQYKKEVAKAPEPKQEPKEINTMSELAAAKGKVVGRTSDKSPV